MSKKQDLIDRWPRNGKGELMFKSSHEAILYAQVIHHNHEAIHQIYLNRQAVLKDLKQRRQGIDVNYNSLMHLACRSAFYRECLEEVDRITSEKFNTEGK